MTLKDFNARITSCIKLFTKVNEKVFSKFLQDTIRGILLSKSICVADIVEPATIVIDGNYVHNNQIMGGIDWLAGGIYLGENAVPETPTNNVIVENHNQGIKYRPSRLDY